MKHTKLTYLMLAFVAMLGLLFQTGCAQQCKQVTADYKQALQKEGELVKEEPPATPSTHIGLGVRMNLLSTVAQKLMGSQLKDGLKLVTKLPLGQGKVVDVDLNGQTVDLKFEQDGACKTCFRLAGNLGGKIAVDIPYIGKQNIPLAGSLKLVAPIVFETRANNTIAIKFDTPKLANYAQSAVNLQIKNLPSSWATALKQPLAAKIMSHLAKQLKPIDLFSFQSPDFGIKGLKLLPSQLAYHPTKQAIFIGFHTNLPGIPKNEGLTIAQALEFGTEENLAMAIHPDIILNAVTLLMKDGKIPRRYTTDGKANESGPAHVTLNSFSFIGAKGATKGTTNATDPSAKASTSNDNVSLGFRAWNLLGAACFWFDAMVTGNISLTNRVLEVNLKDIKIVNSSAPGLINNLVKNLVNWKTADFLKKTQQLIKSTLAQPKINIPGATLNLALSTLKRDSKTLILRSNVLMKQ